MPQSISNHYDRITMKWGKAVYYPEDIEKMKNMTTQERIDYKKELIEQRKYTAKF